jgi:hypothetical protein
LRTGCLGKYLESRGIKQQNTGENYIIRNSIVSTLGQILLSIHGGWARQGMQHAWGR